VIRDRSLSTVARRDPIGVIRVICGSLTFLHLSIAARERFIRAGIPPDQAAIDAEVLARAAAEWDRATWLARRDEPAGADAAARFEAMAVRRQRREPVAYITGVREFWGLDFIVSPAVLIPRPETELIVEAALERLADPARAWRIADVGTGSGCIAVALATERRAAAVTATDISAAAIEVARENATRHGVQDRVAFVETSLLSGTDGPFDLIVANPPYVPTFARTALAPDVREFEPDAALFGHGADGLDEARAILTQAATRLAPGGWLLMEFGYGQGDEVREAASGVPGLRAEMILRDLQGHERTLVARA
jgi:release factor glutamine methyltransferase